ncbi:MAG: hypothetical protein IPK16_30590 [Anaerolineales bacterium]|nr:hypothetical protein [Anaerolineales bacterium]
MHQRTSAGVARATRETTAGEPAHMFVDQARSGVVAGQLARLRPAGRPPPSVVGLSVAAGKPTRPAADANATWIGGRLRGHHLAQQDAGMKRAFGLIGLRGFKPKGDYNLQIGDGDDAPAKAFGAG